MFICQYLKSNNQEVIKIETAVKSFSITGIDIYIVNIEIDTICGKPSGVYSDKIGKRKA